MLIKKTSNSTEKDSFVIIETLVGFDITRKGERSLIVDGYKFTKSRDGMSTRVFWRCSRRECKATAVTVYDKVEHVRALHDHERPQNVTNTKFQHVFNGTMQPIKLFLSPSIHRNRHRKLLKHSESGSIKINSNFAIKNLCQTTKMMLENQNESNSPKSSSLGKYESDADPSMTHNEDVTLENEPVMESQTNFSDFVTWFMNNNNNNNNNNINTSINENKTDIQSNPHPQTRPANMKENHFETSKEYYFNELRGQILTIMTNKLLNISKELLPANVSAENKFPQVCNRITACLAMINSINAMQLGRPADVNHLLTPTRYDSSMNSSDSICESFNNSLPDQENNDL